MKPSIRSTGARLGGLLLSLSVTAVLAGPPVGGELEKQPISRRQPVFDAPPVSVTRAQGVAELEFCVGRVRRHLRFHGVDDLFQQLGLGMMNEALGIGLRQFGDFLLQPVQSVLEEAEIKKRPAVPFHASKSDLDILEQPL